MKPIPPSLQTVYLDLLQSATPAPPSALKKQHKRGHDYLTAHERHGSMRISRHLGRADDPDVQEQATRLKQEADDAKRRRTLVATLRRAGIPGPMSNMGKTLEVLANAGLFQSGGVILVGTAAYIAYSAALGVLLPAGLGSTQDIDLSIVRLVFQKQPPVNLLDILRRANPGFRNVWNKLKSSMPPSRFQSPDGLFVEPLTGLRRNDEHLVEIPGLGASAEALPFQEYLVENPEQVVLLHGSGVPVLVPQPARYGVHKLIVAQQRPSTEGGKRAKDLAQAAALREALHFNNPDAWKDALDDARGRGPRWKKRVDASLRMLDKK